MDRTADFVREIKGVFAGNSHAEGSTHARSPTSTFVLRAAELLTQIASFEILLEKTADSFVDYHRFHPLRTTFYKNAPIMGDAERAEFTQEIAIFVTTFATEVRDLKRTIQSAASMRKIVKWREMKDIDSVQMESSSGRKEERSHKEDVTSYLMERLGLFAKNTHRLQNERMKYSAPHFSFFTNSTNSSLKENFKNLDISMLKKSKKSDLDVLSAPGKDFTNLLDKLDSDNDTKKDSMEKDNTTKTSKSVSSVPKTLPQSFVDRYESEIAPPKQLKEYHELGLKHKKLLLKESKSLQTQFSTELIEANKMEKTVQKVTNLLLDFVTILQGQREQVDDVNKSSKSTLEYVKDADNELSLTIERSESHQRSMLFLHLGFAFFLLLLDFLSQ